MTLAVEDANPKLVDVVAFADVDDMLVTADSLAIIAVIRFVNNLTTPFQHSLIVYNMFCLLIQFGSEAQKTTW